MPIVLVPARVPVTGASGSIAAWVIKDLLDEVYFIRRTLRSLANSTHYNAVFKSEAEVGRLEFAEVPDMSIAGAFDEAVRGRDAALNVASPVTVDVDDPNGK